MLLFPGEENIEPLSLTIDRWVLGTYLCLPTFGNDERRTTEINLAKKAAKQAFGSDIYCSVRGIIWGVFTPSYSYLPRMGGSVQ